MMIADSLQAAREFDSHMLFHCCEIFGTVVGAIAGATASCRVRMDVFGIISCGTIAALGGGSIRDILLSGLLKADGSPMTVYWVVPDGVQYLYYAIGTSLFIFYLTRIIKPPAGTIRVADAFGMAFFTLIGAAKANSLGCPWLISVFMGVCTGVAGGILRDVLTGNVPYVFRPGELYATASFIGAGLFILLQQVGAPYSLSFVLGVAVVFCVRMAAVYLNWQLPSYRPLFDTVGMHDEPEKDKADAGSGRAK